MVKRVRKISVEKVKVLLRSLKPKAASLFFIRDNTRLPYDSILFICEKILYKNIEVVDTTNGRFYRWGKK